MNKKILIGIIAVVLLAVVVLVGVIFASQSNLRGSPTSDKLMQQQGTETLLPFSSGTTISVEEQVLTENASGGSPPFTAGTATIAGWDDYPPGMTPGAKVTSDGPPTGDDDDLPPGISTVTATP